MAAHDRLESSTIVGRSSSTIENADAVTELEVTEYRDAIASVYPFNVKRDDKGRWTIPSHGNYPADAKDKVAKAATLLVGLKKQASSTTRRSAIRSSASSIRSNPAATSPVAASASR
jgi:hypothetical protein